MRKWLVWLMLLPGGLRADSLLFKDDFRNGDNWRAEAEASPLLAFHEGISMTIVNKTGITVWFRHRLTAPVTIRYSAKVLSTGRVSDLNCFWMATDPAQPDGQLFVPGRARDGRFGSYDTLRTYYVGYGGNNNTTTRFRRYDGTGARPLLPSHDLSAPEFLLKPDHVYQIALTVNSDGRVQFIRDGVVVFDWTDPQPLRSGWFGFRSVDSQIEIRNFEVHAGVSSSAAPR
jgi:hypothetical protein